MNVRAMVRGLVWDIGVPVVAYYVLVLFGVSDFVALLVGTLLAGANLIWEAVRERTLNPFSTVMLIVFGLGLVLSFLTGDPRFLLVVKSAVTGAVGLVFLVTAARGRRPLTLAAQQKWSPEQAAELGEEYRTDPDVQRGHRICSTVWGVGLVAESLLRVVIVYLLPLSVAVAASTVLLVAVIAGLTFWTTRYVARAQPQADPGPDAAHPTP